MSEEEMIKIVKVVVNKMPEMCCQCPFMVYDSSSYECVALRGDGTVNPSLGDNAYSLPFRRHDCPLVVEEKA